MCDKCYGRGYLLNAKHEWDGLCDCPAGKKFLQKHIEKTFTDANIPHEFWRLEFKDFFPQTDPRHVEFVNRTRNILQDIPSIMNSSFIWLIYGDHGTGKTLAATFVLKEAIDKGFKAKYACWSDVIAAKLKSSNSTAEKYIHELSTVEVLCIDKVGGDAIGEDSLFPNEVLDSILSVRYSNQKPTILILSTDFLVAARKLPVLLSRVREQDKSEVRGLNFITKRKD